VKVDATIASIDHYFAATRPLGCNKGEISSAGRGAEAVVGLLTSSAIRAAVATGSSWMPRNQLL